MTPTPGALEVIRAVKALDEVTRRNAVLIEDRLRRLEPREQGESSGDS